MSINISPSIIISEWSAASFSLSTLTTSSINLTASLSWSFNNAPIVSSETLTSGSVITSTYSIASALASQAGSYRLQFTGSISGSGGTGNSSDDVIGRSGSAASVLTVNPLVVSSPTSSWGNMVATDGATIVLGGENISSSIPVTYQWYRNGVLISGDTGQTYTIQNQSYVNMIGTYTLVATTDSGSSTTNGYNVAVFPPGIDPTGGQQVWSPYRGGYWQTM